MEVPVPDVIATWQFWVTAVVVYILCEIFKQIPMLKDGRASWLVNLFGVVVGAIVLCAFLGFTWQNAIFGILASAASTLAYEIWSNILNQVTGDKIKKEISEDETKIGGTN